MSESRQSSIQGRGQLAERKSLGRYDCRDVYENMEYRASDGSRAPYRCDSWECYCCGFRMRQNLIEEIERIASERPDMCRLLTLTLDPEKAPDDQAAQHQYITDRWNALRTRLKREIGDFSYIWVREEQENGLPHLHAVVSRYLPQQKVSTAWSDLGGGEIVDIRKVDRVDKTAHYLGKYLTKDALSGFPDGIRRYGSSADLDLAVRGDDDGDDDGREWRLVVEDHRVTRVGSDEYLVRGVAPSDFVLQRRWGGPEPPPATAPPSGD